MDFCHLIVTCLFSMRRLPFDNQKVKGNYAILLNEVPDFWCLPPGGTAHTIRWYDDFRLMVRRVPY